MRVLNTQSHLNFTLCYLTSFPYLHTTGYLKPLLAFMAMTAKMVKFCQEYLVDMNGTQAAIRSGYSEDTAASIACENLTKPEIQAYIEDLKDQDAAAVGVTRQRVLREWARLAFFDIRSIYGVDGQLKPIGELESDSAAAIAGVESYEEKTGQEDVEILGTVRKVKIIDKTKALDALSRHLGMFNDKLDLTSNGETLPVQIFSLPDNSRQNAPEGSKNEDNG